jgi:hypothetical protein
VSHWYWLTLALGPPLSVVASLALRAKMPRHGDSKNATHAVAILLVVNFLFVGTMLSLLLLRQ